MYRITINVTDDGNGQLVTSAALKKSLVTFTNVFEDDEQEDKDTSKKKPTKKNPTPTPTNRRNSSRNNVDSGDHSNVLISLFGVMASLGVIAGAISRRKRN